MNTCGAATASGQSCKRRVKTGTRCHFHTESQNPENTCSVCLCELTGPCKRLACNHEFHRRCIIEWKNRGNNTCPYCRAVFAAPPPMYRVSIHIENVNRRDTRPIQYILDSLPDVISDLVDPDSLTTEIQFDGIDSDESLRVILEDFGLRIPRDSH
jgi:hypothetical protein